MCRDLVLKNLALIPAKNSNSVNDFTMSENGGKVVVNLQAFPHVTPIADTINTQVGSEIEVIQLE